MTMTDGQSSPETAIVKVDSRQYRKIAQENWGLTDAQMKGMHVHHRIPQSQGGTNDPSNLYVCCSWFHAHVWHDHLYWVETTKKLHEEKNSNGMSVHAVKTLGPYYSDPSHQKRALQAAIKKNPNHQKDAHAALIKKRPDHQSKAGKRGGAVAGPRGIRTTTAQRWMSTVDGFISNPGNVAQHNKSIGADPSLRVRVS